MILPARSIPPPTPSMRINMQIIKAPICHPLFPNAEAILPKAFPYSSTLSGARVEPVRVPIAYLKIQPITTVYPIAIAREPRTGIMPRASPSFSFAACLAGAAKCVDRTRSGSTAKAHFCNDSSEADEGNKNI